MYRNLGIHWASSVPAFLALACVPFPFLFWRYGKVIRMKSEYAAEAAKVLERMMRKHEVIDEDEAAAEVAAEEKRRHELQPIGGVLIDDDATTLEDRSKENA
jgi:hypothetical protein